MTERRSIGRKLVAATIVAAGLAVVWGMICGWVVSIGETLAVRDIVIEQIQVASDGTPVIAVESNRGGSGYTSLGRRTLDGKPWPNEYENWLGGAYLYGKVRPPGLIQFPIRWSEYGDRVGAMSDGKKPPTSWYLVSADERADHFYFAGYDPLSKLSVGFIGSEGFRAVAPPLNEQFTGNAGNITGKITSTQYIEQLSILRYHDLSPYERPAQWLAFVVQDDELMEIDLRERSLRAAADSPRTISLNMMTIPESTIPQVPTEESARHKRGSRFRFAAMQDAFIVQFGVPAAASERPKVTGIVTVRAEDRILLYDAKSGRKWEFKLPGDLPQDTPITAYWIDPDTLIVVHHLRKWSGGGVERLYWINADGTVERQADVELLGYTEPPPSRMAWFAALAAPEPIAWIVGMFAAAPFELLQDRKAETYSAALSTILEIAWPMAILVLVASLVAAWYARRMHRRYFRPNGAAWTTFVFLLGVPGLGAYWLEHQRAKLERCGECGKNVPRDRDACAVCATQFAAPPLVGTEIFA